MIKKIISTFLMLLIVSLLFFIGCALSQELEQIPSFEETQATTIKGLSSHEIPAVLEKPMIEIQEQPITEESAIIPKLFFIDYSEDIQEFESSFEPIPPIQFIYQIQNYEDSYAEVNDDFFDVKKTAIESSSTKVTLLNEPDTELREQESINDNPSSTAKIDIERIPMQIYLIILGIILILMMLIIIFITQLKKVKIKLAAEQNRIKLLGISTIEEAKEKQNELEHLIVEIDSQLIILKDEYLDLKVEKRALQEDCSKLEKTFDTQKQKLARTKEIYKAIEHAVKRFHETDIPSIYYRPLTEEEKTDLDTIAPSVMLNLNYMNYQDLRKEFRINQKQIDILLEGYAVRYTTKANQSIYKLMVISLRSELQNILYNLKYEKLENALLQVQSLISKYLVIVSEGNQQVAGTMRKFVGELEHLFENAVKIEYEYYIKREQARQEQLALRQQMREEAEERKRLEEQKKQIALEESKYQAEIEKIQEMLSQEPLDSPKRLDILAKLDQLNTQLAQVEEKKEEITKLQNGKAGNVYIISNLGSFGEHVFKIGMTRRLDPQDRVDELGSASVPFKFDVHSFIFSEDAVGLENKLHQRMHAKRLNKVNLRKEFFAVTIDELERLVEEINPTAEFNRTMLAEDYKQSLSLGEQDLPPLSPNDVYQDHEDDQDEYGMSEKDDQ